MSQLRRQSLILKMIEEKNFVSIDELSSYFDVAPQTIRRDLNQLANAKKIERHHGGARRAVNTVNTNYADRKIMNIEAKRRIAKTVASQIPNGASVFINIGTTTEAVARELLHHKDLMIVTNNIHVATILSAKEDFRVIIASGEVRARDGGIVGEATRDFVNQFRTDYGIIGISGLSLDGSLLDFDYREVRVAQTIINNSRQVFLAADASKIGRNAVVCMGGVEQIDHLFTDIEPPKSLAEVIRQNNVELHVA